MPAALIFSTAAADPGIGSVASQTTPSRSITQVPVFLSGGMGDMLAEWEGRGFARQELEAVRMLT
jgi:hypothetical protein